MNDSRRLAIVSLHTCPSQCPGMGDAGGMNVYVRTTAAMLAACGWRVDIYTRLHRDADGCADSTSGVRLFHVSAGPADARKEDLHRLLDPFTAGVLAIQQHDGTQYRAILSHYWLSGLVAIELARHWQVPHLASFHTLALAKQAAFPAGAEPPERADGERRIVEQANRLIAISEHEADVLVDRYGADRGRISIATPGINRERFRPQPRQDARDRLALPPQSRILLAVGRATAIKGFDVLLQALARIADPSVIALLIGGEPGGENQQTLFSLARSLGIVGRVRFVGSVEHTLLADYYAACDVCVVPSLYESFGLVALEAIACGRPVVASRVGGLVSNLTDNPLGTLVTPGSVSELEQALKQVLDHGNAEWAEDTAIPDLPTWSITTDAIELALTEVI